jgi:hypothetical protein
MVNLGIFIQQEFQIFSGRLQKGAIPDNGTLRCVVRIDG